MKKVSPKYVASSMKCNFIDNSNKDIQDVSIDSRKVNEKSIFFPIIGEINDAHKFIPDVLRAGCMNIVVSDTSWAKTLTDEGVSNIFIVPDTTKALMEFAEKYFYDFKNVIKIGVTGSDGKTSTKEFLASALLPKYKVGKTKGNLNSEYGVPLTIFDFEEDIEAAVIEMGIGGTTKMDDLSKIVNPSAAIITNIGTSHLETFENREQLAIEKLKIASGFVENEPLVINTDNDILGSDRIKEQLKKHTRLITVGRAIDNEYRLYDICDSGIDGVKCKMHVSDTIKGSSWDANIKLKTPGVHNLYNAAEAIAMAVNLGVQAEKAVEAVCNTDISINGKRLEIIREKSCSIINDTYNASPESMISGIEVLMNSSAKRHVAILGDMLELGDMSEEEHEKVGEYAAKIGVDFLITIGENARGIASAAREKGLDNIIEFDTLSDAKDEIKNAIEVGDMILIKASRGMRLEEIAEELKCI